jgi:hypothetical protein
VEHGRHPIRAADPLRRNSNDDAARKEKPARADFKPAQIERSRRRPSVQCAAGQAPVSHLIVAAA